jgi:hypothetical protein
MTQVARRIPNFPSHKPLHQKSPRSLQTAKLLPMTNVPNGAHECFGHLSIQNWSLFGHWSL